MPTCVNCGRDLTEHVGGSLQLCPTSAYQAPPPPPAPPVIELPPGETHRTEPLVLANGGILRGAWVNNAPIGSTLVMDGTGPAVVIPREARFCRIESVRIVSGHPALTAAKDGNGCVVPGPVPAGFEQHYGIHAQPYASNYAVQDVYLLGFVDGARVEAGNFLTRWVNVFSDANLCHGFNVGEERGVQTSTTLWMAGCFARFNGAWGFRWRDFWGANAAACSADVNAEGGWWLTHCAGSLSGCDCESCPVGFRFDGEASRMVVLGPTTSGCPSRYERDPLGAANIISSEVS